MNFDISTTVPVAPRLNGLYFLAADDSNINLYIISKMLAQEGAHVIVANDGRQALECLRNQPHSFAAVLTELQIPVMNGLSILHSVKNDPQLSRLPIIAITGNVQREHLQNTLAAGFDGVIVKPIDQEEMIMILLRLTQSRKGSGEWPSFPAEEMNSLDTSGEFPSISGIDSRKAATALANDRELFLDLLRQFANDCGDAAERIRDDLKQGNQEAAASQLHNLRGALGLLGAVELIKSVQDVEKSIHTSRPDLDQRLNTFMAVFASFKEAIAPWVKK